MTLTPPARSRAMHSLETRLRSHEDVGVAEIIARGLKINFIQGMIRKRANLF
jgi:hypothetical protein